MKIHDIKVVAALVITGLLLILPGCGDNDDDDDEFVCSQNGNIELSDLSMTFDATEGTGGPVPNFETVNVTFPNGVQPTGNVAALNVDAPPGVTLPTWTHQDFPGGLASTTPVDIYIDDPVPGLPVGIYNATYRFLALDANLFILGCVDMSVTYNVNP